MRTSRYRAAALLLGVAAACSEPVATSNRLPGALDPALNVTITSSLDATITSMIGAFYPKGLETAAGTRWETVRSTYGDGTDPQKVRVAQQMVIELARWVQGKIGQMEQPAGGETRSAAATRLATYMALYVFSGPNTSVPTYNPGSDATFEILEPSQQNTITTPLGFAGVGAEAGTVAVPTIVTVSESPNAYPGVCNGPLQTARCQYPLFYDFHMFPVAKFLKPVHVAVCHVVPTSTRRPLDYPGDDEVHERLRLAHPLPPDPSLYTAGATQYNTGGESIEVAPLSPGTYTGFSGVDCSAAPAYSMNRFERALDRFASVIGRTISPAPLYAVDQGPEHMFDFFSPINLIDPASQPDLAVQGVSVQGSVVGAPGAETYQGETVHLNYGIFNTSRLYGAAATATAKPTTFGIYLSTDATINASDVLLGTAQSTSAISPDAAGPSGTNVPVVIPAATAPGTYYIGVYVSPANTPGVGEVSTANNGAGAQLVVRPPEVTGISGLPPSITVAVGQSTSPVTPTVHHRGSLSASVTWTSQNTSIATVGTANGVVTGVAFGSTTVTASAGAISVVIPVTVTINTGAETGDAVWTATSQWNARALPGVTNGFYPTYVALAPGDLSAGALPAAALGASAWWFGQSPPGNYIGTQAPGDQYGSGGTSTAIQSGLLTSPQFTVPSGYTTTLTFKTWFEIESVDAHDFDLMLVYFHPVSGSEAEVARMNPASDPQPTASPNPVLPFTSGGFNLPPAWVSKSVDLSAFAGQTGHLHFYFNTFDVIYNGFRGWLVDDVKLTLVPTAGPLLNVAAPTRIPIAVSANVSAESFTPALPTPVRQAP